MSEECAQRDWICHEDASWMPKHVVVLCCRGESEEYQGTQHIFGARKYVIWHLVHRIPHERNGAGDFGSKKWHVQPEKKILFWFFCFSPLSVALLWISKPLSGDFALQDLPPMHYFSLPLLSPISTATKLSAQEANTGIIAISGYSFAMPTKHVSLERLWFKNNPSMLNSHFVSCSLIYPHNILRINCGTVEYHKLAVHLLPAFTGMILHWARIDNHRVMPSCIWCPEHFELIWIEHIWVTHWTDMSELNLTSWLVNQKTVSCWHLLGALNSSFRSNMMNDAPVAETKQLDARFIVKSLQQTWPALQFFQASHWWQSVFGVIWLTQDHPAKQQVVRPTIWILQRFASFIGKINPSAIKTFHTAQMLI